MNYAKKRAMAKLGIERGKNASIELENALKKDVEGIEKHINESNKEKEELVVGPSIETEETVVEENETVVELTSNLINAMTQKEMNEVIAERNLDVKTSLNAKDKKAELIKVLGL